MNHGRVLVMVKSSQTGVSIRGLALRGDHGWIHKYDASYYLHENSAALFSAAESPPVDRRLWHGMLMVGLAGEPTA